MLFSCLVVIIVIICVARVMVRLYVVIVSIIMIIIVIIMIIVIVVVVVAVCYWAPRRPARGNGLHASSHCFIALLLNDAQQLTVNHIKDLQIMCFIKPPLANHTSTNRRGCMP